MNYVKSKNVFVYIHLFLAVLTLLWMNSGFIRYINQHHSILLNYAIFCVWFLIAVILKPIFLITYLKRVYPLIIYFALLMLLYLFVAPEHRLNPKEVFIIELQLKYVFVIYSIFLFYFNDRTCVKYILRVLLLDYLLVGMNTYFHLVKDPYISRNLSMSKELIEKIYDNVTFIAVGNYSFAYGIVMIGFLFLYRAVYSDKQKLLNFLIVLAILFILIKMNFVISILLFIGFCAFLIILKIKHYFMIIAICAVLFLLVLLNLSSIILFLSSIEIIKNSHILERLEEIQYMLQGVNVQGSDVYSRLELYTRSLNVFLSNPLFGNITGRLGGHSAWLDMLGKMGLLILPMFIFIIREYKFIATKLNKGAKIYFKICYLYCFVLGFVNTIVFSNIMVAVYVIVPFGAVYYISYKERSKNENIMVLQHNVASYFRTFVSRSS